MNEITINRGSDLTLTGVWRDQAGQALDLSDWAIALFEVHPSLQGPTVEWIDAAAGSYRAHIPWNDQIRTGKVASFRLRISKDGEDRSSPQIWVVVQ